MNEQTDNIPALVTALDILEKMIGEKLDSGLIEAQRETVRQLVATVEGIAPTAVKDDVAAAAQRSIKKAAFKAKAQVHSWGFRPENLPPQTA